jgi:hypothetical protein
MMFPRQVNKSAYSRQFLSKLKKDICILLNLPVPIRIDAPEETIAVHTNQVSPAIRRKSRSIMSLRQTGPHTLSSP